MSCLPWRQPSWKGSHDQIRAWGTSCDIKQKDTPITKRRRQILLLRLRETSGLFALIRQSYEIEIYFKTNQKGRATKPDHKCIIQKRQTFSLVTYYKHIKFHAATMRGSICTLCNGTHLEKNRGKTVRKQRREEPP